MVRPLTGYSESSTMVVPSSNPLIKKFSHYAPLSESDRQILDALLVRTEHFPVDTDIVSEGMVPRSVFVLKAGMAIRYRNLPDGGR